MEAIKKEIMETNDRKVTSAARKAALKALGAQLRTARNNAGFTQKSAADLLQVSAQTVRNWEAGRHEPSEQATRAIAALYGVTPRQLREKALEPAFQPHPRESRQRIPVDPLRLRDARRAAGLTQAAAAARAGLSLSSVRRYERGAATPPGAALNTLALTYGKPALWFTPDEPPGDTGDTRRHLVLPTDEALNAYALVQPELSNGSVRTIADFVMFVYQRQVRRNREGDACTQTA